MADISKRSAILTDLKTWLEAITVQNGYQSNVKKVRRGISMADDFPERPALGFWSDKEEKEDLAGEMRASRMHVFLWGYVSVEPGNYDALDKLISDVEICINGSRANWDAAIAEIRMGDVSAYEGGVGDPTGSFETEITIDYEYDRGTP